MRRYPRWRQTWRGRASRRTRAKIQGNHANAWDGLEPRKQVRIVARPAVGRNGHGASRGIEVLDEGQVHCRRPRQWRCAYSRRERGWVGWSWRRLSANYEYHPSSGQAPGDNPPLRRCIQSLVQNACHVSHPWRTDGPLHPIIGIRGAILRDLRLWRPGTRPFPWIRCD